jgi:hypothetical protein
MLTLDAEKIEETIATLEKRIEERFPQSGLSRVCAQLLIIGRSARERSREIAQPDLRLRVIIGILILVIIAGVVATLMRLGVPGTKVDDFSNLVQGIEAGVQNVIFVSVAVYFLGTFDTRLKRRKALTAIHELRAIAHIIDMHQLTKDPERVLSPGGDTKSSPERTLTPFLLSRYLDYCSEMLALVSKIAALYVQHFDDAVVLEAATEVEDLTTGLSQKIWQKIMIVQERGPSSDLP